MSTLADALDANWKGYEELLTKIKKDGCYFGNDDDISNECVKRFADSVTAYFADKTSDLGYTHTGSRCNFVKRDCGAYGSLYGAYLYAEILQHFNNLVGIGSLFVLVY